MAIPRLELDHTALLVVDVQERLLPVIHNAADVERQVGRMIDGANVLGLPILVTEQYRKGLGLTVPALADRLKSAVCVEEKLKFSACIEPVRGVLKQRSIRSVVVVGIEAHVCVQQSVADILRGGRQAHVALDAIASRTASSREVGVRRMRAAGMVPSGVELALFEMIVSADHPQFKTISGLVRDLPQSFS